MSSNNYARILLAQSTFNKENPSYHSNSSTEKPHSTAYPYRHNNQPPLRQNIRHYGPESSGLRPLSTNIQANLVDRGVKQAVLHRDINPLKAKKAPMAERSSHSVRLRGAIFPKKDHHSFIDKENNMSVVETGERYSYGGVTRPSVRSSVVETTKTQFDESDRRSSIGRKRSVTRQETQGSSMREVSQEREKPVIHVIRSVETEKPVVKPVEVKHESNVSEYAPVIMESLRIKEREAMPAYCLKTHQIPSSLRAKMVDWMVEVLTSYKCSEQTLFVAVNTMDLYLNKTQTQHDVSTLHLIGVTCMLMASKYEDIYPLRLKIVCEKIAHGKLAPEQIKQMEMEILTDLGYKMTNVTLFEFIMNTIFQLNLKETLSSKLYDYFIKICMYLAKATLHDYELINQQNYSVLAASVLCVAFRIISKIDKNIPAAKMTANIPEILKVSEESMTECSNRTLIFVKNFEKIYPSLSNLKKFNPLNFD